LPSLVTGKSPVNPTVPEQDFSIFYLLSSIFHLQTASTSMPTTPF
jgi:hypothetical protein